MKIKNILYVVLISFLALPLGCFASDASNDDISHLSPSDQAKYRALQREQDRIAREIERHQKSLDEELRDMQQQMDKLERQNNGR